MSQPEPAAKMGGTVTIPKPRANIFAAKLLYGIAVSLLVFSTLRLLFATDAAMRLAQESRFDFFPWSFSEFMSELWEHIQDYISLDYLAHFSSSFRGILLGLSYMVVLAVAFQLRRSPDAWPAKFARIPLVITAIVVADTFHRLASNLDQLLRLGLFNPAVITGGLAAVMVDCALALVPAALCTLLIHRMAPPPGEPEVRYRRRVTI